MNNNHSVNFAIFHRNMFYSSYLLRNNLRDSFITRVEDNSKFFFGLFIGTICNIYTIFLLLFFNFRPKFKMGLQMGMVLGSFLLLIYSILRHN
jgi:hypothetical protein